MFPVETIIEKSAERDYEFFLNQKNFLLVADSLEKFESCLDTKEQASKDFIIFKQKLYQTYEVRNRSTLEHDELTSNVSLFDLYHVMDASKNHLAEMARENHIERMTNQLSLKGKLYKRKLLSAEKLKGLFSLGAGSWMWLNYATLAATYPTTALSFAVAATSMFGISRFAETNFVDSIEVLPEGDANAGQVKVTIALSPFVTREILAHPGDISRAIQNRNSPEAKVVISRGIDVHSGNKFDDPKLFKLSEDAWVDREGLEWILTPSNGSDVDALFTDLINTRARKIANEVTVQSLAEAQNNFAIGAKARKVNKTIETPEEN